MKQQPPVWVTGEITLDSVAQRAYKQHKPIELSELSFKVMLALVKAYPQSLSSQDLIDQVWQQVAVSPETVTQRIALIRRALAQEGIDHKQYLSSTRHVGYRWIKMVKLKPSKPRSQKLWVVMALVLVGLLASATWFFNSRDSISEPRTNKTSTQISANDLTQQAWEYLDKHTAKTNGLAIGLFRQAISIDSDHVNALTGLSIALSHQVTKFNQSDELLAEARTLALKAVEIDDSHAQAWAALAFVDDANGDLDLAISGYEKAITLAPKNSSTISSLAYLYSKKGRLVEALQMGLSVLDSEQIYLDVQIAQIMELLGFDLLAAQWYRKADVLAPDNVFATYNRARFYLARNQQEQAKDIINQAMDRGVERPELPILLGLMAWKNNDPSHAIQYFQQAIDIDPDDMQAHLLLLSMQADTAATAALQSQLVEIKSKYFHGELTTWPDQWVHQAQLLAHFGAEEEALDHLREAYVAGYRNSLWLQWLPAFQSLQDQTAWQDLMADMQLDVSNQRDQLLSADWLPTSFLDPKN